VTASAATTVSGDEGAGGNIPGGGLSVNGVALGPIVGANAAALAASAAAAIAGAGIAGVSASASGATLTLTAADGRDIGISASGGPYAAVLGLAAGTHSGAITVLDAPSGGAHKLLVGGARPGVVGLTAGSQNSTATGNTVTVLRSSGGGDPPIDLGSASGASDALDFIDAKIDSANAVRAQLGALQNRLLLVYDGDLGGSTDLAAARSRILDTDYASETAQLTRSRILQQAAASMVAQANATPRQALLLLR
jgi:flagellin